MLPILTGSVLDSFEKGQKYSQDLGELEFSFFVLDDLIAT